MTLTSFAADLSESREIPSWRMCEINKERRMPRLVVTSSFVSFSSLKKGEEEGHFGTLSGRGLKKHGETTRAPPRSFEMGRRIQVRQTTSPNYFVLLGFRSLCFEIFGKSK